MGKITIDDIRLRSNLITNKTIKFAKQYFLYTLLSFTHSHSGAFGEFDGFIQEIPGAYKSEKPTNLTGTDRAHLKGDDIIGSIVNKNREPILLSFALDKTRVHEIYKEPRIKHLKR